MHSLRPVQPLDPFLNVLKVHVISVDNNVSVIGVLVIALTGRDKCYEMRVSLDLKFLGKFQVLRPTLPKEKRVAVGVRQARKQGTSFILVRKKKNCSLVRLISKQRLHETFLDVPMEYVKEKVEMQSEYILVGS
jgi:hypothetical protein